jgi:hypothetical protein
MASSLTVLQTKAPEPSFRRVVAALLSIDVLLLLAPVLAGALVYLGMLDRVPHQLKIQPVWGLPSLVIYAKWLLIAICLTQAWRANGEPVLLSLALIFAFLLLDDSLELHEQFGTLVKDGLGYAPALGLRADDFGELTIWAIWGSASLAVFALGYWRSSPAGRRIGQIFILGIAGLATFGIVVDMLNVLAHDVGEGLLNQIVRYLMTNLEDGGELVVASLLLAFAFTTWRQSAALAADT